MIETDRRQLEQAAFELYYWRTTDSDNFTCQLFNLLCKADISNQIKISHGFPAETEIWRQWKRAKTEEDFFRRWRLGKYKFELLDTDKLTMQEEVK